MSDGHTDRFQRRTADIRDANGRDVYVNDTVWISAEDGAFIKANIIEVLPHGTIVVMTKSNSMLEISFKPKSNPSCNYILKE